MAEAHMRDDTCSGAPGRSSGRRAAALPRCCSTRVLAIVNAHVMPLSPAIVIACEGLIVVAAHIVALTAFQGPDGCPGMR